MVLNLKSRLKKILFPRPEIRKVNVPVLSGELLRGKVALVIGGTGGIGIGISAALLNMGCKVIISGRNNEKINRVLKDNSFDTNNCKGLYMSLEDFSKYDDILEKAELVFHEKINILVNAAGVMHSGGFGQTTPEAYDAIMNTNLKSVYFMTQSAGNYMIKHGIKGHILNVSSSSALKNGCSPYEISKAGVASLTRGAAEMLIPYGIVVNAIGPGPVATPMLNACNDGDLRFEYNPSGRLATVEEIGQLAAYMVSDLGNLIVGDTFYISGGSGII